MPIYDYRCRSCGTQFEHRLLEGEDRESVVCPVCGAKAWRKFSAPAIIFKGSGFYKTDHRVRPSSESANSSS